MQVTLYVCPRCKDVAPRLVPSCVCIPSRTKRVPVIVKNEEAIANES